MTRTTISSLIPIFVVGLAFGACNGDDDSGDTMNDGGTAAGSGDGGVDAPGDGGMDAPGDGGDAPADGGDAPADGGDAPADGGMTAGVLGDDCTEASQCAENYCLLFSSNGMDYGFCSRQCVKAEDCPESGWVCNLSPYTACVPDSGG